MIGPMANDNQATYNSQPKFDQQHLHGSIIPAIMAVRLQVSLSASSSYVVAWIYLLDGKRVFYMHSTGNRGYK